MPERRIELARISHHHGDLWLINYKLWATCGCYYDRHIIQHWGTQPTTEEALKIIYENKNKR
jgi:hypothetical protein